MGKKPKPPITGARPSHTLTHADCRKRACLVCFEPKDAKQLRDLSGQYDFINHIKDVVGGNFDINNPRQPVGLCDGCRKKYFSKAA